VIKQYNVWHKTVYQYHNSASHAQNLACLLFRTSPGHRVLGETITLTPNSGDAREFEDMFGNRLFYFSIQEVHNVMSVRVDSQVIREIPEAGPNPNDSTTQFADLENWLQSSGRNAVEARRWTWQSHRVPLLPEIDEWARQHLAGEMGLIQSCLCLMQQLHSEFTYDTRASHADTPIEESFPARKGVCQDFAHIMLAALRSQGVPCRYVSGYLETEPPPGQPKLEGADASHAWVSVFDPALGWVGFDPTNNMLVGLQHLTLAWGRDVEDVVPLRGVVTGGGSQMITVGVDVASEDTPSEMPEQMQQQNQQQQ